MYYISFKDVKFEICLKVATCHEQRMKSWRKFKGIKITDKRITVWCENITLWLSWINEKRNKELVSLLSCNNSIAAILPVSVTIATRVSSLSGDLTRHTPCPTDLGNKQNLARPPDLRDPRVSWWTRFRQIVPCPEQRVSWRHYSPWKANPSPYHPYRSRGKPSDAIS